VVKVLNNLLPKNKSSQKNKKKRSKKFNLGPTGTREKKSKSDADVGLSRGQTIFLAVVVVSLAVAVGALSFWINMLINENEQHELMITRLEQEITRPATDTEDEKEENTTPATKNYADIPDETGPDVVAGAENAQLAEKKEFIYDEYFESSKQIINQWEKLTYYTCNEKAALRLIEDSGLAYMISRNPDPAYNLVLFGDYRPPWIDELEEWERRRSQAVSEYAQSSDASPTDAATDANAFFEMPEELEGLEVEQQDVMMGIQLLSSTSEKEVRELVWVLRNEMIPAYIYSYPQEYTNKRRYTLQIGIFPNREQAKEFQEVMKKEERDFYLELIQRDVVNSYIRMIIE